MDLNQDIMKLIMNSGAHPALGWKHCQRVFYLAKELAQQYTLDEEILYLACMLHDIGKYPGYALPNIDHVLRSKGIASNILKKYSYEQSKLNKVLDAIESHMYYSEPQGTEEAIYLRDANILDSIGNIGIMKIFSLIGHDELIETPEEAIARVQTFADALPKKVSTKNGKRIALKRREEMMRFLGGIRKQTSEYAWV
ncbi:metal-dependent phosphohydrolase HD sub domain protein [Syntrophobotulus glycolicus DSM 8271]|uniref:Metal-dependent phosphohydrolase HD sub domain protein n=1 Tax=Syntrophobotulus glycolicus (strain DSM 8271 / FlGlyR) TaxID=645991 RepID=F0SZK4_SYNGF|nr:HD domain-containing protein [Syntrophobotulus glycolicus]ADY56090.1 metal-dependent phosphohydrolase HD sub domain protein [Syntrophobotulus glycolicus DSM 8271]